MKSSKIAVITLALIFLSGKALAEQNNAQSVLTAEREQVVHQYVTDLGNANAQGISALFKEGGVVISTSRGRADAREFFNAFLPNIASSSTAFHQAFHSHADESRFTASFNFKYKLKDGESGDGEYVDEFIFADHSTKLTQVNMYENLKF